MKRLIIRFNGVLSADATERIEKTIADDLEKNGFALLNGRYEVYEIDTDKEDICEN